MTYTVENSEFRLDELHILINNATEMPIIIEDSRITETYFSNVDTEQISFYNSPKIEPKKVQLDDWTWETSSGKLEIRGEYDPKFCPFNIEMWLVI